DRTRVCHPTIAVDEVWLKLPQQPAQRQSHSWVGEWRMKTPLRVLREPRHQGCQAFQPVYADTFVVLLLWQPGAPHGGYPHDMLAPGEAPAKQLRLAFGATDKRRVEIADDQNPHSFAR